MPEGLEVMQSPAVPKVPKLDIRKYKNVWVDYNKHLEQLKNMCQEKFQFQDLDPDLREENVPTQLPAVYIPGVGHRIWKLPEVQSVRFNRYITSEEVETEFEEMGLRPLTFFEGLSWAEKHWDGKSWEVMLGSSCRSDDGSLRVPFLLVGGNERSLILRWDDESWRARCCFLCAAD